MTNREAIDWLNTDDFNAKGYKEAVKLAINALKKQIPTKPYFRKMAGQEHKKYVCPNCRKTVGYDVPGVEMKIMAIDHCTACGQAVDWVWRGWSDSDTSRK